MVLIIIVDDGGGKIATKPKAKEQLMLMMMVLLILTVVQFILFNLVEICKILGWIRPRVEHKLDPSRVEHFDKRSIFRLNTTTNR